MVIEFRSEYFGMFLFSTFFGRHDVEAFSDRYLIVKQRERLIAHGTAPVGKVDGAVVRLRYAGDLILGRESQGVPAGRRGDDRIGRVFVLSVVDHACLVAVATCRRREAGGPSCSERLWPQSCRRRGGFRRQLR